MNALSYPCSKNPFSLFTASPGLVAAAGPGWQISIGGAAERRSAKVDRIGLVDRELRREGGLASSIGLFDISDGLDPATEALSSPISRVFWYRLLYAEIFFLNISTQPGNLPRYFPPRYALSQGMLPQDVPPLDVPP